MSFFRTYIDKEIQEELFNRIDSLNFRKSPQGLLDSVQSSVQHQFVKSCWARTSVVLSKGEVISLNSNLDENNNPINEPLNIKNGKPYRGKPGITSISTSFKEYFMKQGTINFYVPDPNDFDVFKKQFLKFGRYMLVEFGWSLPYNLQLPSLDGNTILKISKDIQSRILLGNGNYNALVGVVTNYTFNQTKEGAYEGTIEISSMGRNILGQKSATDGKVENLVGYVNKNLTEVDKSLTDDKTLEAKEKDIYRTLRENFITFNVVIDKLGDVVEDYIYENEASRSIDYSIKEEKTNTQSGASYDVTTEIKGRPGTLIVNDSKMFDEKDKPTYITWGWFEDFILNSFFSFTSQDDKINFKTEFRSVKSIKKTITKRQTDYVNRQNTIYGSVYTPDVETGLSIEIPSALTNIQVDVIGSENTETETDYINTLCKTHPDIQSLGFDSIILPGNTKSFGLVNREGVSGDYLYRSKVFRALVNKFSSAFAPFETMDKNGELRGQIRNMVFNVEYLKESFKGTQNIEKSINDFWQKVSNDYGGFWRFAVIEDENFDGRIMVTDMNIGVEDDSSILERNQLSSNENQDYKIFEFPVYSKNSIVTDIQLQSENSSEMATMAVYGSNVNLDNTSADMGKGYTSLAMRALSSLDNTFAPEESGSNNTEKDKSYYDSILSNLSNPVFGNFQEGNRFQGSSATYDEFGNPESVSRNQGILFTEVTDILQGVQKIQDDLREQEQYDTSESSIRSGYYWFDDNDTKVQIYSSKTGRMYDEFKRTMLFLINKAPGEKSNYSVVLPVVPIQLSLSLQGIGGIKVGDLFYVRYLPEQYRKYCHFMVVNVEHEISTTGWSTKLDSRMIVDVPKMIQDKQTGQVTKFEPIIVKNSLNTKVQEIKQQYEDANTINSYGSNLKEINEGVTGGNTFGYLGNITRNVDRKLLERRTNNARQRQGMGTLPSSNEAGGGGGGGGGAG